MSNTKFLLMLILLIAIQALLYILDTAITLHIIVRTLIALFATKFLGDALSRFLFKLPGYDWIYLRDYLKREVAALFTTFVFAVLLMGAIVVSTEVFYSAEIPKWVYPLLISSVLPVLFYLLIHHRDTCRKQHFMRRKL